MTASRLLTGLLTRYGSFPLTCLVLVLAGQASPSAEPRKITFPHENVSDLRGVVNVFGAFRRACLEQPVTRDLPERLVPDGYRIVTREVHWWGEGATKAEGPPRTAVLSRTGREQGDRDGGHPIIEFDLPSDERPGGTCRVVWKRAWDYPDGLDSLIVGMSGVFDAQVSYHLEAVRVSKPDDVFSVGSYSAVSEWRASCWEGNTCEFNVLAVFHPRDGIEISISRERVRGR